MSCENGDGNITAEEAQGCSDGGCVFRSPSARGMHTNAGCRCLPLRMTPNERVKLRRWIRELVVRLDGVGVVECLAARDAATRERARADKAERERDRLALDADLAYERGGADAIKGAIAYLRRNAAGSRTDAADMLNDGAHLDHMDAADAARGEDA